MVWIIVSSSGEIVMRKLSQIWQAEGSHRVWLRRLSHDSIASGPRVVNIPLVAYRMIP